MKTVIVTVTVKNKQKRLFKTFQTLMHLTESQIRNVVQYYELNKQHILLPITATQHFIRIYPASKQHW